MGPIDVSPASRLLVYESQAVTTLACAPRVTPSPEPRPFSLGPVRLAVTALTVTNSIHVRIKLLFVQDQPQAIAGNGYEQLVAQRTVVGTTTTLSSDRQWQTS